MGMALAPRAHVRAASPTRAQGEVVHTRSEGVDPTHTALHDFAEVGASPCHREENLSLDAGGYFAGVGNLNDLGFGKLRFDASEKPGRDVGQNLQRRSSV